MVFLSVLLRVVVFDQGLSISLTMWTADEIARLCYEHYRISLAKQGKPEPNREWTLLAAVVKVQPTADQTYASSDKPVQGKTFSPWNAPSPCHRCGLRAVYGEGRGQVATAVLGMFPCCPPGGAVLHVVGDGCAGTIVLSMASPWGCSGGMFRLLKLEEWGPFRF